MSLQVQEPWEIPEETKKIGEKLLKKGSLYQLVGDEIFEQYRESDFADLYSKEGKPGISPVILAFVSIFQFVEDYPDREAAEAMRMRIDWKYAMHLPLDYAGFDYSVLCEFRERLLKGKAETRIFDLLVKILKDKGLIKNRGKQRTDSTHVLSKVRTLSRVEMVVETLRLAVSAVMKNEREWGEKTTPPSFEERYGERIVIQHHTKSEWQEIKKQIGADGAWFIQQLETEGAPAELQDLPEVQVLKTVWAQQFHTEEGQIVFTDAMNHYNGFERIQTPHDPEARYSKKRKIEWIGDKVQVTETVDQGYPNLITDIAGTKSNLTDNQELLSIHKRLEERDCLPAQHYTDSGYMSGPNLQQSLEREIDLIGFLPPVITKQHKIPDGITWEQFSIDVKQRRVTCPAGHTVGRATQSGQLLRFYFPKSVCQNCLLHDRCCTGKGGRMIGVNLHFDLLQVVRARQKEERYKKDYHQHRSGVEGTLSAMVRGNGLRVSRYIGQRQRHLQSVLSGCAVNLSRTARWQAGIRPQKPRKVGWGLQKQSF